MDALSGSAAPTQSQYCLTQKQNHLQASVFTQLRCILFITATNILKHHSPVIVELILLQCILGAPQSNCLCVRLAGYRAKRNSVFNLHSTIVAMEMRTCFFQLQSFIKIIPSKKDALQMNLAAIFPAPTLLLYFQDTPGRSV